MRNESLLRLLPVKRPADITHFNKLLDFSAHSWPVYTFSSEQKGAYNSTVSIMQTIQHVSTQRLWDHYCSPLMTMPSQTLNSSRTSKKGNTTWDSSPLVSGQPALMTLISSRRLLSFCVWSGISWRVLGFKRMCVASCWCSQSLKRHPGFHRRVNKPDLGCRPDTWWSPSCSQGWRCTTGLAWACAEASSEFDAVASWK